jgi:hypothetical protein
MEIQSNEVSVQDTTNPEGWGTGTIIASGSGPVWSSDDAGIVQAADFGSRQA